MIYPLDVAFETDSNTWTDCAFEAPGHWKYFRPPASGNDYRLEITRFFPLYDGDQGGYFKFLLSADEKKRQLAREANPLPKGEARNWTLRELARKCALQECEMKRAYAHHLIARVVRSANFYNALHHNMRDIMSNDVATTVGQLQRHVAECRDAQVKP